MGTKELKELSLSSVHNNLEGMTGLKGLLLILAVPLINMNGIIVLLDESY
jgi:hypothetical protein